MPFPTPPPDGSGGFVTIGYTDGLDEHFMRLHVPPFTNTVPTAPPYDWTYTGSPPGSETSIIGTVTGFLAAGVKHLYAPSWNWWIDRLHRVSGGVITPVFPIPLIGAEVGTGDATALNLTTGGGLASAARFCKSTYTADTTSGGRVRFVLIAAGARVLQPPAVVTATAGGISADDQALVAYLTGSACNVVAHDGHRVAGGQFKVQVSDDKRLRRKYGFA